MELQWFEDFLALVQTENFSRAAEARNITQPAFSRRVRAFEDWVGEPLFSRHSQGVKLTAAGEALRVGVEESVRRIHQMRAEAREAAGREKGSLHFAATHALSFTFFSRWMRELERDSPPFGTIRLVSDTMQGCEALMLRGEAQFLICHHHPSALERFEANQFRSIPIGGDVLSPFAAPGADGAPVWRLDRGVEIPLLDYSGESGLGRILAAQNFGARGLRLKPVLSAQLATALMTMALHGRGIAWVPKSLAEQDLAAGRLVRAGDETWDVPIEIRLFRPRARQSPTAELFWARITRKDAEAQNTA
ncbi:MAG: LysR family transcriptional regulator [Alphaproteobacteria bacterium]|nr:LysR family transcriptional regulator [Alphaproteobacteria bacterium]